MIKLVKQIVKKGEKRYTNYIIKVAVGEKNYSVAIEPKTFGKDWKHPSVRQAFTLLDIISILEVKDD